MNERRPTVSDLDVLRGLTGQLVPPVYDGLVAVARKRRRRSALAAAATVAVVIAGVGLTATALAGGRHAQGPPHDSSPTTSPSVAGKWTPGRIRAEGVALDQIAVTESGLTARLYLVCDGPGCNPDGGGPHEYQHRALELTQGARSAVVEVSGIGGQGPWITTFGDDAVVVEDTATRGVWPDGPARFRLLRADGTMLPLRLVDNPRPAIPAVATVVIDDFRRHGSGIGGGEETYVLDERARTLRPLESPAGS
jgi:hypothetical protein